MWPNLRRSLSQHPRLPIRFAPRSRVSASDRLLQPPGEAIEQLIAQLNALARGQAAWDAATTRDWLKGQGIALWNSFIPMALQREFWKRRDRITQMTIVSQGDPHVALQ
jgi:hypothetical protein